MFPLELVTIGRTGRTFHALVDPAEQRIYVKPPVDVRRGDALSFRGLVRRVTTDPEVWLRAGIVITYEEAPPFLPDLGTLYRSTPGGFNRVTQAYDEPGLSVIWSGPCSLKADSVLGSDVDVAEQQVTVQSFSVAVPLDLVDVQPDDIFKVSSSRDPWLVGRPLTVVRVEAGSEEQGRIVRVLNNQG